jgi:NitT/TauT family transport system permease protein
VVASETDTVDYLTDDGGFVDVEDARDAALQGGALAVFVALWWAGAALTPANLLPTPPSVASVVVSDVANGTVFELVWQSLRHYIPGLLIGSALGMATGVLVGWSDTAAETVGTVAQFLRPIPPLAWIPFAIIWFGLTDAGAAFIVAVVAFWINYYNAESGVASVDRELLEVAQSLGTTSNVRLVRKVVLPSAVPELITGFRTAAGQAWMVMVAAELLGVAGIGKHLWDAANFLQMDVVMAYMLVIGLLFLLTDRLIVLVQGRVLTWR